MPADESFDRSAEDRRPNTPSPAPRDLASASGQANCHRRRDGSAEDRRPNTPSPAPRDQGSASGASASLPDGEGLREGPLLPERVDPHPPPPPPPLKGEEQKEDCPPGDLRRPTPAPSPTRTIRCSPLRPTSTRTRAPTRSRPSGSGGLSRRSRRRGSSRRRRASHLSAYRSAT